MLNPGLDDVLPHLALDWLPVFLPTNRAPPHGFLGHARRDHKPRNLQVKAGPHLDRANPGQDPVEESMLNRDDREAMPGKQLVERGSHFNHGRPFTLLSCEGEYSVLEDLILVRVVDGPPAVPRPWDVDAENDH